MSDQTEFRLSAWGIRNPVPVTVLFIALVVMGLFSYIKLPVKNFPNVEFPAVAVSVTRNGAAPAEMESQITRQVENSMAGLANVQNIASTITQGSSTTVVQLLSGDRSAEGVRTMCGPAPIRPAPTCRAMSIHRWFGGWRSTGQPIITYAVSAPGHVDAGTVVVHRRHHRPHAAGRTRRCAGQTGGRRGSRDQRHRGS